MNSGHLLVSRRNHNPIASHCVTSQIAGSSAIPQMMQHAIAPVCCRTVPLYTKTAIESALQAQTHGAACTVRDVAPAPSIPLLLTHPNCIVPTLHSASPPTLFSPC